MAQHASAMPDKPLRQNLLYPEAVSASERSGMGVPAGSIAPILAVPETLPLIGEAEERSTSTSTKHQDGHSGFGHFLAPVPGSAAASLPKVDDPKINQIRGLRSRVVLRSDWRISHIAFVISSSCRSTMFVNQKVRSCRASLLHMRKGSDTGTNPCQERTRRYIKKTSLARSAVYLDQLREGNRSA